MKSSLKLKVKSIKLLLVASVFVLTGLLMNSCNPSTKKTLPVDQSKESGEAKLVFSEEIHNFGRLKAGEVVSFTFTFKNEGTRTLTITHVDSGCGCTKVKFPTKPIGPGEEGYIEVIYDSAGEVGRQLKIITLFSNADEPKKLIYLKAEITNELIEIYS